MRISRGDWFLTLIYGLLLAYGTLFPLDHIAWEAPVDIQQIFDIEAARRSLSMTDLMVNFLVYLPWGFLLFPCFAFLSVASAFTLTILCGAALSISLEYIQLFIPLRVASFSDIIVNTLGTALGALGSMSIRHFPLGRFLRILRDRFVQTGALADMGMLVLGCWALSELTPLVPSLDLGNLKQGIKPLWFAFLEPERIKWVKGLVYFLDLSALGILLRRILFPSVPFWKLFWLVCGGVLLLKIPVVGRQMSPESCLGLVGASLWIWILGKATYRGLGVWIGCVFLFGARAIDALTIGDGDRLITYDFNWIPFAGQQNGVVGLIDILLGIWPYLALAFFGLHSTRYARNAVMLLGGGVVFGLAFYLEWRQQSIPGRYPDATDAYLALIGWLFAWYKVGGALPTLETYTTPPQSKEMRSKRKTVWLCGSAIVLVLFGASHLFYQTEADFSDGHGRRLLSPPDQLPPPILSGFQFQHPRLPAPSFEEIMKLKNRNSAYLKRQKQRAASGRGDFNAIALAGFVDPGSIDMAQVTSRLLALKYTWRGHEQAMPVALLYDWLYPYFSPSQRAVLQEKLAEGCRYLSNFIRREALSPYNVYLYNSPFQALMAVALALYGDHPEGEQCMAFTYDLWKNRVLPVWRQVMGRNGGWHEGGEYVGIGIGRAVYSVTAMWRRATGEDLFRTEPGIRGFLDFLIYRHRPDHTHMRWGDGAFFDRRVPERFALALEYRDRAAYSFFGCHKRFEPTAWPWGPLPDDSLCAPTAAGLLPLQKQFDGIGMLIARSDWSDDATYVTFKAGNNYWSHSHLDQGAFTLYKGGPLAIDSGMYGPYYGSDHHMNYSYQTIAHNVITVTDPEDTAPMPGKDKQPPRPIANDGGQRRVGSGWGKRAPIDLNEWQAQSEIYHTGRIHRYYAEDDLVIAVAELAPAYTNDHCGEGDFFARTCRVERYWRTFVYDRKEDVIVVYDDVTATDPSFIKRSLIHTRRRPRMKEDGFVAEAPPDSALHRRGGRLEVKVLFPEKAWLNPVGGPGVEFWVDGKNHDAQGKIWENIERRRKNPPEPGRWRVEVVPPVAQEQDRFLMVLFPSLAGETNNTRVMPLKSDHMLGCRLVGIARSLTLTFPHDRAGVMVRFDDGRRLDLTLPPQ
ncbi:MAG: DUF4962 domain-containing protein [Methylohalobius sp. ZOD2]